MRMPLDHIIILISDLPKLYLHSGSISDFKSLTTTAIALIGKGLPDNIGELSIKNEKTQALSDLKIIRKILIQKSEYIREISKRRKISQEAGEKASEALKPLIAIILNTTSSST